MRPWKTFYRLLGIQVHESPPTHYQLLDLPPQHCTVQAVDDALAVRKKQLRQSIPSPEFLAPIARFEREHLEPAAAILRDPARRAAYDRRLQRHRQLLQNRDAQSQRQTLVAQANQCLHGAINLDGTLDEHKRDALINELTRIGLSPAQAQAVVDRLRKPSQRLNRLGAAHIQQLTNQFLQLLAATCPKGQISRRQYIALVAQAINMGLPAATAHRLLNAHQNRTSPPGPLAEADLFPEPAPAAAESTPTPSRPDLPGAAPRPSILTRHGRLLAALAVTLLALLLAVLFFAQTQPHPRPVAQAPSTAGESSPAHPAPTTAPDISRPSISDHPASPARPLEAPGQAGESPSDHPEPPPLSRLPRLDDFRRVYPNPRGPADKLADFTLALLACAERAARFTNQPDAHPGVLASVLDSPNPTVELTGPVELGPDQLHPAAISDTLAPTLAAALQAQIQDPDRAVRYRAIEELRLTNSPQAARLLLDALASAQTFDQPSAARILHAINDIEDPYTPLHLLQILADTRRRPLAQLIVQTLLQANRMPDYSPLESDAALPFQYSAERLGACLDWWCRHYGLAPDQLDADQSSTSAVTASWTAVKPTNTHALSLPQYTLLALTVASSEYARNTAAHLQTFTWQGQPLAVSSLPGDAPESIEADPLAPDRLSLADLAKIPDLSQRLVASLAAVTDQCLQLVRLHPDAARLATQADLIELDRQTQLARAETPVHQALAETRVAAELLNLLLQLTDAGQLHPDALKDLRPPGQADLLDQLRYAAYHNLALWDLLARQDAAPATPQEAHGNRSKWQLP